MSPEEHLSQSLEKLSRLKDNTWLLPVATKMHSDITRRIFDEGVMGNGSKIGTYAKDSNESEKPFVNLTSTGALRQDFTSGLILQGNTVVIKLNDPSNAQKAQRLKEKYGPTLFQPTQQEKETFTKELTQQLLTHIKG